MAGKNDNFDALMAMMALKHIMDDMKDIEIHPFTCEVTVTPTSISCSSSGNKAFLEDIDGGMEWAEETSNLIKDIMSEQTIKLTDLMKKKFGFDTVKVKPDSEDGFADFLKNLFGGGVQTIANKINNLPAIALERWQSHCSIPCLPVLPFCSIRPSWLLFIRWFLVRVISS